MNENFWECFKVLFHLICWICTISSTFYWIYLFSLNEDSTVLQYKKYYHGESDKYPMLSLCFESPFNNSKLEQMSPKVNATSYVEFLDGNYFSTDILQYDYQNIIFNISEYVVNYYSQWKNETKKLYSPTNYSLTRFSSTFAGFWRNKFYHCYGFQMPDDQELEIHGVLLKSDIFPSKIRPKMYDFLTLIHYPNHLMRSLRTKRYFWTQRTANDTYGMVFRLNDVEIIKRRNKNEQPCNQNGNDYDKVVQAEHSEMVGCRAPYHETKIDTKLCSTSQDMKKAKSRLRHDEYGNSPPCTAMEKISYLYEETDFSNTNWENNGHFWVELWIGNPRFKEIVQTR